jgi:hypothetical protein
VAKDIQFRIGTQKRQSAGVSPLFPKGSGRDAAPAEGFGFFMTCDLSRIHLSSAGLWTSDVLKKDTQ